jgi:hypothetical protein
MNNACDTPACASAQADTGKPKKRPKVHKFFCGLADGRPPSRVPVSSCGTMLFYCMNIYSIDIACI